MENEVLKNIRSEKCQLLLELMTQKEILEDQIKVLNQLLENDEQKCA